MKTIYATYYLLLTDGNWTVRARTFTATSERNVSAQNALSEARRVQPADFEAPAGTSIVAVTLKDWSFVPFGERDQPAIGAPFQKGDWVALKRIPNLVGIVEHSADDAPVGVRLVGESGVGDNYYAAEDLVKIVAKSDEEIARLKQEWDNDPVWDIEETEGFEAHRATLLEYHLADEVKSNRRLREQYYATAEGRLEVLARRVAELERQREAQDA